MSVGGVTVSGMVYAGLEAIAELDHVQNLVKKKRTGVCLREEYCHANE